MSNPMQKMYKLVVNGQPACESKLTVGLATGCTSDRYRDLEIWSRLVMEAHPEATVEIIDGRCTYTASWEHEGE